MKHVNEKVIEEIVKRIVAEQISAKKVGFVKNIDKSGVLSIKTETVKCEKFDTGKKEDQVYLKDILTLDESPRLGCGIMEMKKSKFDWVLNYDEIDYVIDGTLEIVIEDRRVVGNKGDIIMIPKGTPIQFCVPDYARFMYVTYPANWQEMESADR
ncbi:cupin domain-containing protein [Crassaminicella thermophila]|uniref:cupin domain-containing protein n=1 Tax=Crassaminicella thermophila TaxID=2599308 RepID=UPI001A9C1055|nr:cupin domain-containing protein [Crassaminicella thermophila]